MKNMLHSTYAEGKSAEQATAASIVCLALGLWMLRHPFVGIEHDGIIYAAMAGVSAGVLPLGTDLFFSHGEQFRYSVYPWLAGALVQAVGVTVASAIIVAASHLLFLGAAWALVRPLTTSTVAACSLVALAIAHPYYGNSAGHLPLLSFGEGFATARPIAEATGLWAIAFVTRGRLALAAAACIATILFHPLTALVVSGFVLLWVLKRSDALLLAGAGVAVISLGAISRVGWFFSPYDGAWAELVDGTLAGLLFPSRTQWDHHAWNLAAFLVCALGCLSANLQVRRIAGITVVLALFGFGFSVVAEITRIAGLVAVQTWRVGMLVSLVGALLLPILLCELAVFPNRRARLILPLGFGWLAMTLTRNVAVAYGVAGATAVIAALPIHARTPMRYRFVAPAERGTARLRLPIGALAPLAVCVVFFGVVQWDARTVWSRFLSQQYAAPSPVDALVPPHSTVFWVGAPVTLQWFWLKRGSYVHVVAATNATFSRELGAEFMRRADHVAPLWLPNRLCGRRITIDGVQACLATPENVASVCKNAVTLDYVLAPSETNTSAHFTLSYPSPASGSAMHVSGYRCQDFRSHE